jgi:hypothetical protein
MRFKRSTVILKVRKNVLPMCLLSSLSGMLKRATAEGSELAPIESELNNSAIYSNGDEEIAAFLRILLSFLTLNPSERPRAREALKHPIFMAIP